MALAAVVRGIAGGLDEIFPTGDLLKLKIDDGSVHACFKAQEAGGERITVTAVYSDPESYPSCGALVMCEGGGGAAEKLEGLSERFQDRAPLTLLLSKVCDALGVVYIEDALRRHEPRGRGSNAGDAAAAASAPPSSANNAGAEPMSEGSDGGCAARRRPGRASGGGSGSDADAGGSDAGGSDDEAAASSDEAMEEQSSDDESSEDEDRDLLVECGVRQGKWERHEAELAKAASATALSMEQAAASKRQIFTSAEGFKMLSNELLAIIRKQDPAMFADSVGDDVYKWDVWLSDFDPNSQMAKDMDAVSRRLANSTLQLRFTFMRGLHPFFPPLLEVVRPHLAPPMLGALCSHPMLRLANWDPWRPLEEVVASLKAFVEAHGRVDVENPLNNHPDCAYSPLEAALGRLEALTDVKAAAHARYADLYTARDEYGRNEASLEALQQVGKKLRLDPAGAAPGAGAAAVAGGAAAGAVATAGGGAAGAGGAAAGGGAGGAGGAAAAAGAAGGAAAGKDTYWARGTGYGFGASGKNTWDPKAAEAAQKAHDEQLQAVLGVLLESLTSELGGSVCAAQGAADGAAGRAAARVAAAAEAVRVSVLLPFLWHHLCSAAFTEMTSRSLFYTTLLRIVQELCRPGAAQLLGNCPGGGGSPPPAGEHVGPVGGAVAGMQNAAKHYAAVIRRTVLPAGTEASCSSGAAGGGGPALTVTARAAAAAEEAVKEARVGLAMADLVTDIVKRLDELKVDTSAPPPEPPPSARAPAAAAPAAAPPPEPRRRMTRAAAAAAERAAAAGGAQRQAEGRQQEARQQEASTPAPPGEHYLSVMRPMQVDYHPGVSVDHLHLKHSKAEAAPLKTRAARVAKEIAGLERLLPLTESSSVFVRVDEGNTFLWRAMITGPEDTPYSGGCFVFDIYFPGTYPHVPPMVLLKTTGGGRFRFNPNLYNCGKVCLSLLGTWSGGQGESWNPDVSTTFQVLISIQSLILVDEPYFNEPGFERSMHTEQGRQQSRAYNKPIKEETIKLAMLDQLRHPPGEWKDAIQAHFRIRGQAILATVDKWIADASDDAGHRNRLTDLRRQLAEEIGKLRA